MNRRAVFSVIALLALGAGATLLWLKLEQARSVDLEQPAAKLGAATYPDPAATDASAHQLKEELGVLIKPAAGAPPAAPPASASPADLQKRAEARRKLMAMNPELAEQLQLTPEESEQFFDLLSRQQLQIADLIAARAGSSRDGAYSQSLLRDIRTMELADDAEQGAMLAGKYPQWLQYQEAELQRNPVDQLQGMLARQDIGLAYDRIDPLATALAAEQKRLDSNASRSSEPQGNDPREQLQQELRYASTNRQQLLKVASRYLDTQQLDAYAQLLEQRTQAAQRLLRVMEDQNED